MSSNFSESEYNEEVRNQAGYLAEAVDDTGEQAIELVFDVLDGHEWFNKNRLSGAEFGAIVSDFDHFSGNPEDYRDPSTLTTGGDFSAILRKMAFAEFEADVLSAYQNDDY